MSKGINPVVKVFGALGLFGLLLIFALAYNMGETKQATKNDVRHAEIKNRVTAQSAFTTQWNSRAYTHLVMCSPGNSWRAVAYVGTRSASGPRGTWSSSLVRARAVGARVGVKRGKLGASAKNEGVHFFTSSCDSAFSVTNIMWIRNFDFLPDCSTYSPSSRQRC